MIVRCWVFFKTNPDQNEDFDPHFDPKELPLILAFLKCTSEMRVQLKIDKSTSDSE